jgi:hypothetical protein
VATEINPDQSTFVFATGKKGSGKSVLVRSMFDDYPYDRLVIDVTGDIARDLTADGIPYTPLDPSALPLRFPSGIDEGKPVTAVLVPDMGSPTALDDMDRALGLALSRHRTCVWIDEIGVMTNANATPPNLRRALHHGRHVDLTLLMAGPRPMNIDVLVLAQADYVAVFALPNPKDRARVAEEIGWPPRDFAAEVDDLGQYEFLWYDARENGGRGELYHMPPLRVARRAVRYPAAQMA